MNSFSPPQPTSPWWVEVYTSVSRQTYDLGPFSSREEAKIFRGAHVEGLHHQRMGDIVALIKQR